MGESLFNIGLHSINSFIMTLFYCLRPPSAHFLRQAQYKIKSEISLSLNILHLSMKWSTSVKVKMYSSLSSFTWLDMQWQKKGEILLMEMDHLSLLSLTLKTTKGDQDKRGMPSPVSLSLFVLLFAFFQYFSIEFLGSM